MHLGTHAAWEKQVSESMRLSLDAILREGSREMLQKAIEGEVADYIEAHKTVLDPTTGRRMVVRNGRLPSRELQSALGPIPVSQPRVRDRREGEKFTSRILPPFMRRAPNIQSLIAILYLKCVSTNDFPDALRGDSG